MKKITSVLIAFLLALTGTACVGCKKQDGPKDTLTLQEEGGAVTMQNDAIRIAFNRSNGSIREVYNKRSKMYLVQDNEDAEAVTIRVKGQTQMLDTSPEEGGFRYAVERDTDDSYIQIWESADGIDFEMAGRVEGSLCKGIMNAGMSGDGMGHVRPGTVQYLCYAHSDAPRTWGHWATWWSPLVWERF